MSNKRDRSNRPGESVSDHYRKLNPARALWWERFDQLSPEVKQLIWDSPVEPTEDMLLTCEELNVEIFPENREEPKLNAKQRAWLARQKAKEEYWRQRNLLAAQRRQAWLKANPEYAKLQNELYSGMTQQQIREIRILNDERAREEAAKRRELYEKVMGKKPPTTNVKVPYRYND